MKTKINAREALREILFQEMKRNPDMMMMGESFLHKGSWFAQVITPEFHRTFGTGRILEAPVSENGIVGLSFGAALAGITAVPEIYSADFLFCTGNEIINDLPKWRYQHRYERPIRMVIRAPQGVHPAGGGGPEHSQCVESYLYNAPGATVVAPGCVRDMVGLMRSCLSLGDPVVFLEHRCVYELEENLDMEEYFTVPVGRADIAREGTDLTIVAWGMMRNRALKAAEELFEAGISAEVVDPRTIKPMDFETIAASVRKTGKLIVAEESPKTGGIAGEIIASMLELCGGGIKARRLAMPDIPNSYVPAYELASIPDAAQIAECAKELIGSISFS